MGGARCSYQNCSQKSDKKTHMFHYPVFDKVRCHQWITNAQKLNYLNLKLSQLKNRMVCQHHFTDDCFMNEMKKKLKNNAIPTLDGPFCSKPKKEEADNVYDMEESEMPINIDDIENEFTPTTDKKAHFSVKYGDFLTNDVAESITLSPDYKSTSIMLQDKGMVFNRFNSKAHSFKNNQITHSSSVRRVIDFPRAKPAFIKNANESSKTKNNVPTPTVVAIEFDELNLNASEQNQMKFDELLTGTPQQSNVDKVTVVKSSSPSIPVSKKVRIISEKHLLEPVKLPPGELQPVSPSIVIKVPDKKKNSNIEIDGKEIKTFYVDTNVQPKNMHDMEPLITYTHLPQVSGVNQIHQNVNHTAFVKVDQVGMNNYVMQNADSFRISGMMDYIPTAVNYSSEQLEQKPGILADNDHNMSMVPNVEFVSASSTGPSVFTLTDVPQPTVTDLSYTDSSQAGQNSLLSIDSNVLNVNQEHSSAVPVKSVSDAEMSSMQSTVEKSASKSSSPNKRFKMHPEKLAAIEEKRKYNMKLRDIINSCLNNMDDDPDVEKLTAAMKKEISNKKVAEHFDTKNSNQPQSQADVISYFETRLQRMEDNLLNKIEQNTQKIIDMKKLLKKQNPTKKSSSTQTYCSAEATKRSLYEQVSKYLTPDVNSLIYEELFINQCISKTATKRRKRNISGYHKEL